MDEIILKNALKSLRSEMDYAEKVRLRLESLHSPYSQRLHDEEEDMESQRLLHQFNRIHVLLASILEAIGLTSMLHEFSKRWESLKQQKGGICRTGWNSFFDFLECPTLEYLTMVEDSLRALAGAGPDSNKQYEYERLLGILESTATILHRRNIVPENEKKVNETMNNYLEVFFPTFVANVQIEGMVKSFKPDGGIRELQTAVEYKFVASKSQFKTAISGVFEDITGYSGSNDWKHFITVIYQTEPFENESRVRQDFWRVGVANWAPIVVTGVSKKGR